ncbi:MULTISPECIES: hypothetical protein [Nocardiaceae]|uniref:Uncharacterized protein n=1 Tax=Rhodococcoides yunnanense TaxID=278209 RepID=A0ABU4B828_9NOCA|nr:MULTISPECIES: hypothetical protein [Rhodococcus]MDI9893921.1 hypothetical protein [Rhodococcus sp. IEGM 1381]MDV6260350.1 hypothetical protein [Rhodococcus yunnanensis]
MSWDATVRRMCLALPETYEEQAWVGGTEARRTARSTRVNLV